MPELRHPKEVILDVLVDARDEDLEYLEAAFRYLSDTELDVPYRNSGMTCRQTLAYYRKHRAEIDNAIAFVKTIP